MRLITGSIDASLIFAMTNRACNYNGSASMETPEAMKRMYAWKITVDGAGIVHVEARTYGAACRKAFAWLIALGRLKRQPASTDEGDFEGVHCDRPTRIR